MKRLRGTVSGPNEQKAERYQRSISKFNLEELWSVKQMIVAAVYTGEVSDHIVSGAMYDIGTLDSPRYVCVALNKGKVEEITLAWTAPDPKIKNAKQLWQWTFGLSDHLEVYNSKVSTVLSTEEQRCAIAAINRLLDEPDCHLKHYAAKAPFSMYTLMSMPSYVRARMSNALPLSAIGYSRSKYDTLENQILAETQDEKEYRLAILETWRPYIRTISYNQAKRHIERREWIANEWHRRRHLHDITPCTLSEIMTMQEAEVTALFNQAETDYNSQKRQREADYAEICAKRTRCDIAIQVEMEYQRCDAVTQAIESDFESAIDLEENAQSINAGAIENIDLTSDCTICFEDHTPTDCDLVRLMTPAALRGIVAMKLLCPKCWRLDEGHTCVFAQRVCRYCQQHHHARLCPQRPRMSQPIGIDQASIGENRQQVSQWRRQHLDVYMTAAQSMKPPEKSTASTGVLQENQQTQDIRHKDVLTAAERRQAEIDFRERPNKAKPPGPFLVWPEYWQFAEKHRLPQRKTASQSSRYQRQAYQQQRHQLERLWQ